MLTAWRCGRRTVGKKRLQGSERRPLAALMQEPQVSLVSSELNPEEADEVPAATEAAMP